MAYDKGSKIRLCDLAYDLREHEGKIVRVVKHNPETRLVEFSVGEEHIAVPERCAVKV